MASTRLYRTFGTPTLATKYTCSFWMKRGNITVLQYIFNSYSDANNWGILRFNADDKLEFFQNASSSTQCQLITNRFFRDVGAWYHVVIGVDTTQGTPADRNKIYINGVQETSFSTETNFGSSDTGVWNGAYVHTIGRNADSGGDYFDGSMGHFHWIDGTQDAASDFGETDSTSGIWVPKTGPSVTYGNNGCFLKFQDTAAYGDDSSGNTNDFTLAGTMTQTKDTPTNNFATMNPLENYWNSATLSNGMTTVVTGSGVNAPVYSTLGVTSGKWYWEYKPTARGGAVSYLVGVASNMSNSTSLKLGYHENDWAYKAYNGDSYNNNSGASYGDTWDTGDIIGLALDATNSKLYFAKNNVWQDSGDPTSGATGTGALSLTIAPVTADQSFLGGWMAGISYEDSGTATVATNFGNGYFGTTAVTSAEADGDGIGAFEYAPPTGYFALCTTNIKAYGG